MSHLITAATEPASQPALADLIVRLLVLAFSASIQPGSQSVTGMVCHLTNYGQTCTNTFHSVA